MGKLSETEAKELLAIIDRRIAGASAPKRRTLVADKASKRTDAPSLERILIIPDSHHPYHDKRAWSLAMTVGRKFKPDIVYCGGDLVDCYDVSDHPKDPSRKLNFQNEVDAGILARKELESLGASRNIVTLGNHEFRLPRFVAKNAPALHEIVTFEKLFGFKAAGWEVTDYRKHTKIGKLYLTHDIGRSGEFAHVQTRRRFAGGSVVINHTHRMGMEFEGDARGRPHVGAVFGHLADIEAIDYLHRAQAFPWQLGFGIGYHDRKTGVVHLVPVPIIDYRCVVNGALYEARSDSRKAA